MKDGERASRYHAFQTGHIDSVILSSPIDLLTRINSSTACSRHSYKMADPFSKGKGNETRNDDQVPATPPPQPPSPLEPVRA